MTHHWEFTINNKIMKILGLNFGKQEPIKLITEDGPSYQSFSTPFGIVGKGDLSKPYVSTNYTGAGGSVRFGEDNLFPQLINQMYYTSPLNSAIIDLKVNATVGGGFEIVDGATDGKGKVDELTFIRRNKVRKLLKSITRNYVMHGIVYVVILFDDKGMPTSFKLIPSEKVRTNKNKTMYLISDDWSRGVSHEEIKPYSPNCNDKKQIITLELEAPGQDIYPIPSYTNAFNWCYLDGEMSYFHKSNIQNSIFPSFALMLPKMPASKKEEQSIKDTLEKAKGASQAGKAIVFAANNKEQLPSIEAIPTNSNDQLFLQTDERIDLKISQAHQIDPILAGIRTSGKLGSGSDIVIANQIFEKNVIIPLREDVGEFMNELMMIFKVSGEFVINEFQIIDLTIEETTNKEPIK